MKVVAINGSARGNKGNTHASIKMVAKTLEKRGINVEIIDLVEKKLHPCKACQGCKGKNRCVQDDDINEIYQKMLAADGIILGSPTYFSNVTSRMQMIVERTGLMARLNGNAFKGKVGTSIAVARRAGQNFVYAALNFFFGIAEMTIVTSSYWNNIIAGGVDEAGNDEEGTRVMKTLGENLAKILNH
ncbi:MAG: flavodoxin family protein [Promethearchaeota archaeon]